MGKRNQGGRRLRHSATRGAREAGACRETSARAFLRCAYGQGCPCAVALIERAKRFFGDTPCRHITEFINSAISSGRSKGADLREAQRFAYRSRAGGRPARRVNPENRRDRAVYRPVGSGDGWVDFRQPGAGALKRADKGCFRNRARFKRKQAAAIVDSLYKTFTQPTQEATP